MYSQYSYYQNSVSAPSSQQQTQTTTTTTSGQIWNGQQWIAATQQQPVAAAPSYAQAAAATATAAAPAPTAAVIKHGKTHAELIAHYTSHYHGWNAQSASSKAALAALPPPHPNTPTNNAQREEMERREKWAAYYASNSAALAHYHLALGRGGSEPYGRPASPPPPPTQAAASAAEGAGGDASGVAAATSVGNSSTAEVKSISIAVAAASGKSSAKKKSRWASVDGDKDNHGKSSASADAGGGGAKAIATAGGASSSAAAVAEKKDASPNSNGLYSKFVQEKSPNGDKLRDASGKSLKDLEEKSVRDRIRSASAAVADESRKKVVADAAARPPKSATKEKGGGGKKRKLPSGYDSSLSTNSSYYGPSSSSAGQSKGGSSPDVPRRSASFGSREEDYISLGLSQPLGGKAKKEKKKLKKIAKKEAAASPGEKSGFDSNKSRLSERAHRFRGHEGIPTDMASTDFTADKYMGKTTIGGSGKQLNDQDYEEMTVKGTCQKLEKEYLRLTSPPRAELVRPQPVLERHLCNLKRSYYEGGKVHDGRDRDYDWYCSQLKAMRQDLTVQRVRNAFAVDVYETHARVALEEDDINEYNQSQTQLKELYDLIEHGGGGRANGGGGGGGKHRQREGEKRREEDRRAALKNRNEFIAYRIIYYVFLSGNRKYEGGSSDIFKIMLQLTPEQRMDESIHHALLVRAAVAGNDYHKFFKLQDAAPNMSDYLMDKIVPSVRRDALRSICKAYRPSVSANFVLRELGFDVEKEAEGGRAWMEGCGCRFEGGMLITKDTVLKEVAGGAKNSLI